MKNIYVIIFFAVLIPNLLIAQNSGISGYDLLELSNPDNLSAPMNDAPGFPSRASDLDVLPGFQNLPHAPLRLAGEQADAKIHGRDEIGRHFIQHGETA